MTVEAARQLAKTTLSPKRYTHVKGVAAAAVALARRYGEEENRAALAAWLHDIMKEQPEAELLQTLDRDAIMAGSTKTRPTAVWHGPCAAIYAKYTLGIEDEELLEALDCHTTGRPGLTRLDKILLVADRTSAERDYPGVEAIRAAAGQDLDKAVGLALQMSIELQRRLGRDLDPASEQALAWLLETRPDLKSVFQSPI